MRDRTTRSSASSFVMSLLLVVTASDVAFATSVRPKTWRELTHDADFLGVVECVTAGGIVSRHVVAETWKGEPAPGDALDLRFGVDYWEPQFPIALVGQRFLIAARTVDPSPRLRTLAQPVPLWWRDPRADLFVSWPQGSLDLDEASGDRLRQAFGTERDSLDAFRDDVSRFLSLSLEAQELELLHESAARILRGHAEKDPRVAALRGEVMGLGSVDEVIDRLLRAHAEHAKRPEDRAIAAAIGGVLGTGGRAVALTRLREEVEHPQVRSAVVRIEWSLGIRVNDPVEPDPPTAADVAAAVARLESADDDTLFKDFETLTDGAPAALATRLRSWRNPRRGWRDAHLGYGLGSWFGAHCPDDVAVPLLRSLLGAREPYIRVAAAVYLAIRGDEDADSTLRALQSLPDEPGAWAALALARRGDEAAVPRLLALFDGPLGSGMDVVPTRNLRKRVLVLLSNSAARSGVPAPPSDLDHGRDLRAWWADVGGGVSVLDPRVAECDRLGVD